MRAFLGYVNEAESQKKIIYDVFSKGDSAFISGTACYMNTNFTKIIST